MGEGQKYDPETPSAMPEFKTNISPLDRLLGYNESSGSGTGIRPGDIIVLRGGPGSGKTTLGLQIMSSFLASDDCRHLGRKPAAVFLSLELEPDRALDKVKRDFGFFNEGDDLLTPFPPSLLKSMIRELKWKLARLTPRPLQEGVIKFLLRRIPYVCEFVDFAPLLFWRMNKWVGSLTRAPSRIAIRQRDSKDQTGFEGILFIDSINALLTMVHQYTKLDQWESRLALNSALYSARELFNGFVILVSSEFHREPSWVPTGMSESFISDVEILLANEPIVVPAGYETGRQGSVGYNIFKIIKKAKGGEGTKLESRSFIRVLKSRKGANQSRRCAYDIVTGAGLTFYETYPGDGHILLFTENPKQETVWNTFFREDLPELYPALRYEHFDRSSLQRIFMNQRRSRYVPSRTDMYVSSFDNYWINWYGELCWRRAAIEIVEQQIQRAHKNQPVVGEGETVKPQMQKLQEKDSIESKVDSIEDEGGKTKEGHRIVAEFASAIHRSLMEHTHTLRARLSILLRQEKQWRDCLPIVGKKERNEMLDAVVTAFAAISRSDKCMKCFACRSSWWILWKMTNCEDERSNLVHEESAAVSRDVKIRGILAEMYRSSTEYCSQSPVRQFFKDLRLSKASEKDDRVGTFKRQQETAYQVVPYEEQFVRDMAEEICGMFETGQADCAPDVSRKMRELSPYIRSDDVRAELEGVLWHLARHTKRQILQSEIEKMLRMYLEKKAGCECRVEFQGHLEYDLAKRIDDENGSPEQEALKPIHQLLLGITCELMNGLFETLPRVLIEPTGRKPKGSKSLVCLWKEQTKQELFEACYDLVTAYYLILKKRNMYHFLKDVPEEKVRLFGERRSRIIWELEKPRAEDKRPLHRPGLPFTLRGTRSMVSVPYNANIGFMVYRHDLVEKFIKKHLWEDGHPTGDFDSYVTGVSKLYGEQIQNVGPTLPQNAQLPKRNKKEILAFVQGNVTQYLANGRHSLGPIQTWEELIVLLRLMDEKTPSIWHGGEHRRHFVIETQTLDTLLCTILEFLWNCGGNLRVRPDYSIEDEPHTKGKLFQALYLLTTMLKEGIIPDDSTLDATHFAHKYSRRLGTQSPDNPDDWVFARQWYSTLVELLTAEDKLASRDGSAASGIPGSPFLWRNPDAELGIMPVPISLSHYLQCSREGREAKHISCWGDWHLIMTKGTENTELAIDLVNSLMSSQKICERAFQCAAVPTVEEFYTLYGESRCLSLPERRYETPEMPPDITFNDLRSALFANARSRSQIFDYEHCMLELQSLFQFVRILARSAGGGRLDWNKPRKQGQTLSRSEELRKEIDAALDRIKALRTRGMLTV